MSQPVLLGDVVYPVSETFKFDDKKVVFLNTSDIEAGKFLHANLSISKDLPGQAKKKIKKNDILFSEIRPANKRFAYVDFDDTDRHVVSTKLMVLRSRDGVHPRFAYHWITAPQKLQEIQVIAESRSGTFPQITFDTIRNLKLVLPEYSEQQKIANFLDVIDEKIELNLRMNETLEQIGQALFKHYFIGSPEAKTWPKAKFSDFTDVSTGKGSTKSKLAEGGEYLLYGANGVMGTSDEFLFDEPLIITGRVGSLGNVRVVKGKYWLSDNVIFFRPKKGFFGFVYLTAKTFDYASLNRGSTQPLITQTDIKNQAVTKPQGKVLQKFEEQFSVLLEKIQVNNSENQNLTKLRNSLLPRLISGKIKV